MFKKVNLTKKDIESILQNYDLGYLDKAEKIKEGEVNTSYYIKTNKKEALLRVYRPKFSKEEINLEHKLIKKLKQIKQVPKLYENKQGLTLTEYKEHKISIFEYKKGEKIEANNINTSQLKNLAKLTANMHKVLEGFKPKEAIDKEAITKESVKHHLNKIKNLPKTKKEYVLNVLSDIKYPKNLSKRIVHADMHLGNMVFDEKQVTGLFDFDDCFYGPKLMDIASIIRYVCFYDKKLDKKRVNIFLEEYQKYAALSKTEKANLWQITRLFNIIHYVYNLYDENNWKIKKNHEYFEEEIKK